MINREPTTLSPSTLNEKEKATAASPGKVIDVQELRLYYRTDKGPLQAVDNVIFSLARNRTLVIVGESGCGKSTLAKALLRLLPRNIHTYAGRVILNGSDVMTFSEERFRREVRWLKLALVPQSAQNSLNPVLKVGEQIAEPLLIHRRAKSDREARVRAMEAFKLVGLPTDFLDRYPFELSGGMRQRATIAMALATEPDLVLLDEPTSALDVLTQANIMNLLKRLKKELDISFILITHDIATSSEVADEAAVMYAGQMVELSTAARFYRQPLHPYSQKLIASVPTLRENKKLEFIPGRPPSLIGPPSGCRFKERCPQRFAKCEQEPPLMAVDAGQVRCWLYE
jgi:oligopeptide/dipeptide ABC transporter ATP-binding protein